MDCLILVNFFGVLLGSNYSTFVIRKVTGLGVYVRPFLVKSLNLTIRKLVGRYIYVESQLALWYAVYTKSSRYQVLL